MKALMAAASAAVLVSAFPFAASAQTVAVPPGVYGNIGYTDLHVGGANIGAITGRLGYRFNPWLGAEGELSGGVMSDSVSVFAFPGRVSVDAKLSHQEAIYGVGFWPIAPAWELIGRVGYSHSEFKLKDVPVAPGIFTDISTDSDSWNYGVGGQYHWDGLNGVRVDYTRQEFDANELDHADVWSIAYSRKF